MITFAGKVLAVVKNIPRGKTLSYREVARRAGNSRAARAVGTVLRTYDASKFRVPCHRVVHADGSLGGYRWGCQKKLELLRKEKTLS